MMEPRLPKYDWGQRVTSLENLYNDGSFPEVPVDELLVAAGSAGEIVRVGTHVDSNTPIYLVEFGSHVVGCLEEEIAAVG